MEGWSSWICLFLPGLVNFGLLDALIADNRTKAVDSLAVFGCNNRLLLKPTHPLLPKH